MAYGLKYDLLCKAKNGITANLKLYFNGYAGSPIDRNMPGNSPLVFRKDPSSVIKGTSVEFGIREEVDFEMLDFYSNDPRKIKAELYYNSTLIWTGYNAPQQYEADYVPAPSTLRFTATDFLGLLKNEDFNLTGRNSQLAIIMYCCDKIGLNIGYSIAINLFESSHDTTRTCLAQTFEDTEIYAGKNCYDVIESILTKYNAEITQVNARWHITCKADKKSARMLYTYAGVYEGTESAPSTFVLGYPKNSGTDVWPVGTLKQSIEAGGKKVTISHDYGKKDSLLKNYNFDTFTRTIPSQTPGLFANWTKSGTFSLTQRYNSNVYSAFLSTYSSARTDYISQSIAVTNVPGEDFVFQIDVAPFARSFSTLAGVKALNTAIRIQVTLTNGTATHYLTKIGWTTTESYIDETVPGSLSSPVWNTIKILTDEIPISGTLTVNLFRLYLSGAPRSGDIYSGVAFSSPLVYFVNPESDYATGVTAEASFDNSTEPNDLGSIEVAVADAPDYVNKELLYTAITWLVTNVPTETWLRLGASTGFSLIVQLALMLASENKRPKQKLSGTIRSKTYLPFNAFITHAYNNNREYEITQVSWDIYEGTYSVTLVELLSWTDETVSFTTKEGSSKSSASSSSGSSISGIVIGNAAANSILQHFELVNPGEETEYIRCKKTLASDYDLIAYTNSGQEIPLFWSSMPVATTTAIGGIKLNDAQMEFNASNQLTIKDSILVPASHTHAWGDIISGVPTKFTPATHGNEAHSDYFVNTNELAAAVAGLVDSSPAALNTLNELAAALGDDPNFATTVTNQIATKAPLASPTFTGQVTATEALVIGGGNELWTQPSINDTCTLWINYRGYADGHTQFRNVGIQNGKASSIAFFDGVNSRVGIGTSAPADKLDVKGGNIRLTKNDDTPYGYISGIYSSPDEGLTYTATGHTGGWYGVHDFYTIYDNGSPVLGMRIKNGRVGIGRTDPQANLDVVGTTRVTRAGDTSTYLSTTVGDISVIFNGYDPDGYMDYHFQSNGNEIVTFKGSTGNVGIGINSPSEKLQVAGNTYITGFFRSAVSIQAGYIGNWPGSNWWGIGSPGSAGHVKLDTCDATGAFLGTGLTLDVIGNITATGEVTAFTSSDLRLKKNIHQFSATAILDRLNPVIYNWNDTAKNLNSTKDDRLNYGLVAQELEEILPELVHPIYDKYKSIDYIQLIPIALQATKETNNKVAFLEKKVKELEREIKQLKAA